MNKHFSKYNVLGNDMLMLDPKQFDLPFTPTLIQKLCTRHTGIGADGICYGPLPDCTLPTMRFFNPDGSEAEKSGNGLRIFARYLRDEGLVTGNKFKVGIGDEVIGVEVLDDAGTLIAIDLGKITFAQEKPDAGIALNISNPHLIIHHPQPNKEIACSQGAYLENSLPERTNVEFMQIIDKHNIRIEIWERGAGYTLASGTCSSAAAGAAIFAGNCQSPITVHMAGGVAKVAIDDNWQVRHTSEVVAVYAGTLINDF